MNIRLSWLATLAITCLGFAAYAEDDLTERCLAAAGQDDPQETLDACSDALDADPENERAQQAFDAAKAALARANEADHPAKLNQN